MKKRWCQALVCAGVMSVALVGVQRDAFAQSEDEINRQVEQLSEAGGERYGQKDYRGAIALFEQAYDLHPVPNLLYNIARCHEKLEQWDQAVDYYEKFIIAPDIDTNDRKAALVRIDKLREIQNAQQNIKNNDGKDPNATTVVQKEVKPVDEPKGPSKIPGALCLGVGIAALGGGGFFGLQAQRTQDDFNNAQDIESKRAAQTAGVRQALIADGLYAGGAVMSIVGTILLIRASKKSESGATTLDHTSSNDVNVTWSPALGKGFGGMTMGVTF